MNATSDNLPVVARNMGGAVVDVLNWPQHLVLDPRVSYAIGYVVARHPELNTEARVDFIADMAGHYGEAIDQELTDIFDEFRPEMVHVAIDLLCALGMRGFDGGERDELIRTVELFDKLEKLGELDFNIDGSTRTAYLVGQLGSLNDAWDMSSEDIAQVLMDDQSAEWGESEERED